MREPKLVRLKPPKEQKRFTSMALDTDVVEEFRQLGDKLEPEFGFRPTHTQILKYLLKLYKERVTTNDKDSDV